MRRNKKAMFAALAGSVSLALILSACGSSDSDAGGSTGTNVAKGDPITFGALTASAGSSGTPDPKAGLNAAVWYVNNELGGVNGRPVKIDLCEDDQVPATAVSCGNQFVSKRVPVVLDTYDHGIAAAAPALIAAGIPYVGELAGDTSVEKNPNPQGFYFTGPLAISVANLMPIMQASDVKTANFVGPDVPAVHAYFDKAVIPMAQRIGVTVKPTYIDATTTSFDSVAATLQKGDPDIIGNVGLSDDQVSSLISALRTQGWDKALFGSSATKFAKQLPAEQYTDVTIAPRTWLPPARKWAPEATQKQLDAFANAMKQTGHEEIKSDKAIYAFASLVNLVDILNNQKVTDVSSSTIVKAIQATKDMPSFLGPTITCDGKTFPGVPTACAAEGIYFTVQSDGSFKPSVPDGFVPVDLKTLFGV